MKGLHILNDGNNAAYRANVVTELYTKTGERTSAIIGVLNITHTVLESLSKKFDLPVKEMIYAWDRGHSKRRTDLYPDYKGRRANADNRTQEEKEWMTEFIAQANVLYDNLHLFGIKNIRVTGWEGDDLIYGMAKEINRRHPEDEIVIVSTDEDFHQLIAPHISVYSPIKQVLYTYENYKALCGIAPELFISYKILKGDSSDNIGGIPGIGEKTAKAIVNNYGGINTLLFSYNREALMKSKRTAKIFTPEGLRILDRNNRLINLKDYVNLEEVQPEINRVLDESSFVDSKKAREFLMHYQLVSILTKWKTWIEEFELISEDED